MKSIIYCSFIIYLINIVYNFVAVSSIPVATTIPPDVHTILANTNGSRVQSVLNNTRRILVGEESGENRPYMVFLKLPTNNPKYKEYRRWLCGGVIVHESYILTSAACIEDAKHFYVVAGTYRHDVKDDRFTNPCIKYGARKAVWKCVPRNYVFDGHENDNIRWMNNDIAIVKVDEEFDFNRRVRGCDFVPKPVCYNNQSNKFEDPGTNGYISGWGSTAKYNEMGPQKQDLMETKVQIISKSRCKKRWGKRYYNIIENYMICTMDLVPQLAEICAEKYVDCTDITYSSDDEDDEPKRRVLDPSQLVLHSAYHNDTRRDSRFGSGGFCENDHGGPLVVGEGVNAMVIGIISACLVKERTNLCYGPFLYTSVYKNRNLINCAIYKNVLSDCEKLFRSSETHYEEDISWADHPDGPAKNEIKKMRRQRELLKKANGTSDFDNFDKVEQHEGVVVRAVESQETTNSETPTSIVAQTTTLKTATIDGSVA